MLVIRSGEYESLRRHGEETYPFECCGALLGRFQDGNRFVEHTIPCGSTRADRPQARYNIDPKELLAIQRQADQRGIAIVGFYHSHPDHPAQWSKTDLAEAHWLSCSYVIPAVGKGSAASSNSFARSGYNDEDQLLGAAEMKVLP